MKELNCKWCARQAGIGVCKSLETGKKKYKLKSFILWKKKWKTKSYQLDIYKNCPAEYGKDIGQDKSQCPIVTPAPTVIKQNKKTFLNLYIHVNLINFYFHSFHNSNKQRRAVVSSIWVETSTFEVITPALALHCCQAAAEWRWWHNVLRMATNVCFVIEILMFFDVFCSCLWMKLTYF